MGRYIEDFRIYGNVMEAYNYACNYLNSEGFSYIEYHGEMVFKKGYGIIKGPEFFKLSILDNVIRLEAWMKIAFLPGLYFGESGLTGFIGCAAKGPLKRRVNYLEQFFNGFNQQNFQHQQYPG